MVDCSLVHLNTSVPNNSCMTADLTEIALEVAGMSCAACVIKVERALLATPGVANVSVNLATKRAAIQLTQQNSTTSSQNRSIKPEDLAEVANNLGFKACVTDLQLLPEALQRSQMHEVRQWAVDRRRLGFLGIFGKPSRQLFSGIS